MSKIHEPFSILEKFLPIFVSGGIEYPHFDNKSQDSIVVVSPLSNYSLQISCFLTFNFFHFKNLLD